MKKILLVCMLAAPMFANANYNDYYCDYMTQGVVIKNGKQTKMPVCATPIVKGYVNGLIFKNGVEVHYDASGWVKINDKKGVKLKKNPTGIAKQMSCYKGKSSTVYCAKL